MSRRVLAFVPTLCLFVVGTAFVAAHTLDQSPKTTSPTVVYIVRHAEKTGEKSDADLSDTGKIRAGVLAWMLRDIHLDAVLSTNVPRTVSTARPTADAKGLAVSHYEPNAVALKRLIRKQYSGRSILVCGHSNTIPDLLRELGVGIKEDILGGYDDLFVVVLGAKGSGKSDVITHQRLHYPGRR